MEKILFVTIIFCATFCFAANFISKIERTHPNGMKRTEITYEVKDSVYYPIKIMRFDSTGHVVDVKTFKDSLLHGEIIHKRYGFTYLVIPYNKGKIHGTMKVYYPNSILEFSQNYKYGKRHGKVSTYFDDGTLQRSFSFKNGIQNGKYTGYYPDGTIKVTGYRKNEKPKGKFLKYFSNGQIEEEGKYKNSKKSGLWLKYDEDGNLLEHNYHNKNKPEQKSIWYYPDNSIKAEGYYIGDQRVGRWFTFYESGDVKEIAMYDSIVTNNPFGICEEYWEGTQKIRFTGFRRNDLIDSLWVGYDSLGIKLAEYNYYKGELNGLFTMFYNDGSIHEQGIFVSNKKNGTWKKFDENSILIDENKHRANIQHITGEYRTYHDNGALQSKQFYVGSQKVGISYSYYKDGSLESIDNRVENFEKGFYPDGKLRNEKYHADYNNGFFNILSVKNYYMNGNLKTEIEYNEPGHIKYLKYKKEYFENGSIKVYRLDDMHIEYYENGKIYITYEMKFNLKNGLFREFDKKTGIVRKKTYFKDGKKHGEDIHFNENGTLSFYANYINGKRNGICELYHRNERLRQSVNYLYGEKEGEYIQYYESGVIQYKCNYEQNRKIGEAVSYDENGNVKKIENFDRK